MERTCQAFAKAGSQRGIERFRLADNAVGGGAVADAPPRFVSAKTQHFRRMAPPVKNYLAGLWWPPRSGFLPHERETMLRISRNFRPQYLHVYSAFKPPS